MISAEEFLNPACAEGFDFWSGVPCSFLTPFINYVIESPRATYIGAASEGEAVAIASGGHLAGRKGVVICQNSGLGNTVNPFTSLNYSFRIPVLLIVTHRGAPGIADEPQHELMGQITEQLLDLMRINWEVFPSESHEVMPALQRAKASMEKNHLPYAFIMKRDTIHPYPLTKVSPYQPFTKKTVEGSFVRTPSERMARYEAICKIQEATPKDVALFATTGKIGRELFTAGHKGNQLYCVGSMGCASALGLGFTMAHETMQKTQKSVVIDGDGALLMKMGSLGTIGHYQPKGLTHIVLDNEAHESTGAQATVAATCDFAEVAAACGYNRIMRCDDVNQLDGIVKELTHTQGPHFVHVKVAKGSLKNLGRPTVTPEQVKIGFMEHFGHGH